MAALLSQLLSSRLRLTRCPPSPDQLLIQEPWPARLRHGWQTGRAADVKGTVCRPPARQGASQTKPVKMLAKLPPSRLPSA